MNPVELLRQPWAATIALALCMWAQIPHSRTVFEHWAKEQDGSAFAWGFEAAVLMFVVRNMHVASWVFASLSALINVGYYELRGVDMLAGVTDGNWICWLLSLTLPFTIAMYSHVLAHVQRIVVSLPAWVFSVWGIARNKVASLMERTQSLAPINDTQPVAPNEAPQEDANTQPVADDTHTVDDEPQVDEVPAQVDDTQPVVIDSALPAQLDEMSARIVASIAAGNYTPYAIYKDTGIALTTLRRKDKDKDTYSGRIPQLCAQGVIRNSSGVDGTEYRLAE